MAWEVKFWLNWTMKIEMTQFQTGLLQIIPRNQINKSKCVKGKKFTKVTV